MEASARYDAVCISAPNNTARELHLWKVRAIPDAKAAACGRCCMRAQPRPCSVAGVPKILGDAACKHLQLPTSAVCHSPGRHVAQSGGMHAALDGRRAPGCAPSIAQNADNESALSCYVDVKVEKDMKAPIYVYYELTGFYQNHRRCCSSRAMGASASSTACIGDAGMRAQLELAQAWWCGVVHGAAHPMIGLHARQAGLSV